MKLHSDTLSAERVFSALRQAKQQGRVSPDIEFVQFDAEKSRSRRYGFKIQLGTYDKTSGPSKSRRYKNSGQYGADSVYAATYDEWGWFIAALLDMDAEAVFGGYRGRDDFNRQTGSKYVALSVEAVPS